MALYKFIYLLTYLLTCLLAIFHNNLVKPVPECLRSRFRWSKDDAGCEWWQLELWDVQSSSQNRHRQQTNTQLLIGWMTFL